MKRCKNCSHLCNKGATFCPNCGASLDNQKGTLSNKKFLCPIFCFSVIIFPLFTLIFYGMGIEMGIGGGGFLIGIVAALLLDLTILCGYLTKVQDSLLWAVLAFFIYNIVVGIFVFCIFAAIGQPIDIFEGIDSLIAFLGLTFGISIITLVIIFLAYAMSPG
ncbi:MAG: membrane protein of unknown function [Promethearchaeota archaeon]|nr:MAG: membrane protein of unknown function [Candidatus Lokiarchaeota archaeon]